MKLKLNPTFSTTSVTNDVNGPITLDLSIKTIKYAHRFKNILNQEVMCFSVNHPLQNGHTTYYIHNDAEIEKIANLCIEKGVEIMTS
jgi:hypothetical protein